MKASKKISAAEREIMNIIWESKKALCVNDIFDILAEKDWKYTTVATFLTRLCQKEILTCEKKGKQNYYAAAISLEQYLKEQTEEFVNDLYGGNSADFIAALAKDKISKNDYDELMSILKKYETE